MVRAPALTRRRPRRLARAAVDDTRRRCGALGAGCDGVIDSTTASTVHLAFRREGNSIAGQRFPHSSTRPGDGGLPSITAEALHEGDEARGQAAAAREAETGMVKLRSLCDATFETPDLEKAIAYYTQINGLAVADREKNRAFLASKVGQLLVQLEQADHARCAKLSFEVAPNSDFNELAQDLAKD